MGVSRAAVADAQYNVLDLGTLGGATSEAYDINSSGRVVGFSRDATGLARGFVTSPNTAINGATDAIPYLPGGTWGTAYGINSSGTVAGSGGTPTGDRGFRYTNGTLTNLGTVAGNWSEAHGINGSNQAVGWSAIKNNANSDTHAALFSGNKAYDLGTLMTTSGGYGYSYGYAINASGAVTGYSSTDASGDHPFLWTPNSANGTTGTMVDVGTLGGSYGYAWSVNDGKEVVGASGTTWDAAYHAFRYANGVMSDLGSLGGDYSEAFDINLSGIIVGVSSDPTGSNHAFVYSAGVMQDLNSLIPAGSGWTLENAKAINDSGQIVGYGTNALGQHHAFLLTPSLVDRTWNVNLGGMWSASGNWAGGAPSGTSQVANFGTVISQARTITVDQPVSVAGLNFNSSVPYTIAGTSTLTLSSAVGNSTITVASGSHLISAPLALSSSVSTNVASASSTMTISGNISSTSNAGLIKFGPGLLVLSGNNTYTGPTRVAAGTLAVTASANLGDANNTVILAGGTLRTDGAINSNRPVQPVVNGGAINTNGFNSSFGELAGAATFTKQGAGKLMVSRVDTSNIAVSGGTLAVKPKGINNGASTVVRVNGSISVAPGAALDLTDHDLVVTYSGASPFSDLQKMVIDGYSEWPDSNKSGIISSTSQSIAGSTILALFDNALVHAADFPFGSGQTISEMAIVGRYTYFGDTDLNGMVTADDYGAIDSNLGSVVPQGLAWLSGDGDFNGIVTPDDYITIDSNLGRGQTFGARLSAMAAVPEPGCGLALGFGALAFARGQRRRKQSH
ncbi:MAG TPA: autotransporter-associated beta strand repeat-containing protein [Tepidisphaeraceae bacterium]